MELHQIKILAHTEIKLSSEGSAKYSKVHIKCYIKHMLATKQNIIHVPLCAR